MPTIGRHVAKLSGYAPALPTPFDDNGDVDGEAFERLCDLQIASGATALVVCGTTGEASTLTSAEQGELIRIAVGVSCGRVPVIAGAGANATQSPPAREKRSPGLDDNPRLGGEDRGQLRRVTASPPRCSRTTHVARLGQTLMN